MESGVIKKIVPLKGFGFITPDGKSTDLFFHKNALVDVSFEELQEGDKVTFDEEDSQKGKNATSVRRV